MHRGDFRHSSELSTSGIVRVDTPPPSAIFSNVPGFQPSLERRDAPQDDRTDLALLTTNCGLKTRAYAPVILAKARFQIGGQSQTSSLATFLDSSLRWKDRMRRRMTERT